MGALYNVNTNLGSENDTIYFMYDTLDTVAQFVQKISE